MSKQQEVPPAVEQDGLQELSLTESDSLYQMEASGTGVLCGTAHRVLCLTC